MQQIARCTSCTVCDGVSQAACPHGNLGQCNVFFVLPVSMVIIKKMERPRIGNGEVEIEVPEM
jgi:hypothetical protein